MSNLIKTVLLLMASAFLTHLIPFNHFFRSLNTMVHEFAHAVMTLALSGNVMFIELYANHSGVTYSQISSAWSLIPISLAGYTFASLFAWYMFHARSQGKERLGLQMITLVAILSLVLFVRNGYGITWLIGFMLLNIVMLAFMPRLLRDGYYLLLSFLMLEEAVFGSFSLILYAMQDPGAAGDATNLAQATSIPAIGWAIFFTVFSLWCATRSLRLFFGGRKSRRSRSHAPAFQPRYEE